MLAWNDVLHEGPLAYEPAESRPLRARFLAGSGWGDEQTILDELERRDEAIAEAPHVALWFEHDLFDQLQLVQILSQLGDDRHAELVQADVHLGPVDATELERLWETRQPVDAETLAVARAAWRAVCSGEVEAFLTHDTSRLPRLAAALGRLVEERAALPRTKRQLLVALSRGPSTPVSLFAENQALEEAAFLGDTWCFRHVHELAQAGLVEPADDGALPAPPPRGNYDAFASTRLELTAAGRAAVAADA